MIGLQTVLRLVIIVLWSVTVVSPQVSIPSAKFVVVRPGQIPVAGVRSLATASTDSVFNCVTKCLRSGDIASCVGFVYRPDICKGTSGLQAISGSCEFLQFFNLTALSYGPATSSCERFFATTAVNLALGKPATQVSTYDIMFAYKAVDGDIGTSVCTGNMANPWWSVDLLQPYLIGKVVVVNDNNPSFAFRLSNFFVKLTNVQPTEGQQFSGSYQLCAQYNGDIGPLGTGTVVCSTNIQPYRYVIVQGFLTFPESLCMAEVSVYLA